MSVDNHVGPARVSRRRAPGSGSSWRLNRAERIAGYVFILPTVILFALFVGWPILSSIYLSFTTWAGFGEPEFTGLRNYIRMVSDPVAQRAFFVTITFAVVTTVLQTVIPLIVAVLVNSVWKGLSVAVRTMLFIPGVVSFVVSGVLWKLIYDPNMGTLNGALTAVGLPAQHWLSNPNLVLPSIILVGLWGSLGMNMLIFFAGIQGVDSSLYEAAEVDGATKLQQFFYVTIPGLRVVTAIIISLNLMNGFKVFDIIFVMTGGGPDHASEVFGTYLYNLAFGSTGGSIPQLGYGSAFSVVVMLMCGLAVIVQVILSKRASR